MIDRRSLIATVFCTAVMLGGCFGKITQPYPEIRLYTLEPVRPLRPTTLQAAHTVLIVQPFTASPGAGDSSFLLRHTDNRVERDYYNRFAMLPPDLVQDRTAAWLRQTGRFADVRVSQTLTSETASLRGHVLRVEGDFSTEPAAALMAVQFLLEPARGEEKEAFFATYEQRVDLAAATPEDLAKGWEQALVAILESLESDLAKHGVIAP